MYFWRIEALKDQLRDGQLGQRAALGYVLVTLLAYTLPAPASGLWGEVSSPPSMNWLVYGTTVLLTVGGTYVAYRANGGPSGSDFIARYFALSWVLSIRLAVLLVLPAAILGAGAWIVFAVVQGTDAHAENGVKWGGWAIGLVFLAAFYWRIVHHLRQVAAREARRR